MKQVVYAEKALLMGDEVVNLMMEYAVLLARKGSADSVDIEALDAEGNVLTATFLIGPATIMVAETARTTFPEPENETAVTYLHEQIGLIRKPPFAHGLDDAGFVGYDEI